MKSFIYAFRGLARVIKYERSMRIHLCFTFYVICCGIIVSLTSAEWTAVIICMGLVMALECLNTAIEQLCDTLCPEKNKGIGIAKDIAAGAVLCAAFASAIVGAVVFINTEKIERLGLFAFENPFAASLLALTIIPAVLFAARVTILLKNKKRK